MTSRGRRDDTESCEVTLLAPRGTLRVSVPLGVTVSELMPDFAALGTGADSGRGDWRLAPAGGDPYPPDATLRELGLAPGATLRLEPVTTASDSARSAGGLSPESTGPSPRAHATRSPRGRPLGNVWSLALRALVAADEADARGSGRVEDPRGLTLPATSSPLDRVRRAWAASDYDRRLEQRIVAPRLCRCATIAVVSPKGGPGKTTITALLGSLLAFLRRDRVIAVDANPDFGSLGRRLAPGHTVFLDDLLAGPLAEDSLTTTQLDAQLGRGPDGLMVAPAPDRSRPGQGARRSRVPHAVRTARRVRRHPRARLRHRPGRAARARRAGLRRPARARHRRGARHRQPGVRGRRLAAGRLAAADPARQQAATAARCSTSPLWSAASPSRADSSKCPTTAPAPSSSSPAASRGRTRPRAGKRRSENSPRCSLTTGPHSASRHDRDPIREPHAGPNSRSHREMHQICIEAAPRDARAPAPTLWRIPSRRDLRRSRLRRRKPPPPAASSTAPAALKAARAASDAIARRTRPSARGDARIRCVDRVRRRPASRALAPVARAARQAALERPQDRPQRSPRTTPARARVRQGSRRVADDPAASARRQVTTTATDAHADAGDRRRRSPIPAEPHHRSPLVGRRRCGAEQPGPDRPAGTGGNAPSSQHA